MTEEDIYSEKYQRNNRTYFFDVKKSKKDYLYLKITESKITDSEIEKQRIFVFEEDIPAFVDSFIRTLEELNKNKNYNLISENSIEDAKPEIKSNPAEKKPISGSDKTLAYSVEKIRQFHKNAYMKWSKEDDEKLEKLYCEQISINELCKIFGRRIGAIKHRIAHLELEDKYGLRDVDGY